MLARPVVHAGEQMAVHIDQGEHYDFPHLKTRASRPGDSSWWRLFRREWGALIGPADPKAGRPLDEAGGGRLE